jgi:crotonobetainyl-CoA:carnitine CoA-transferase CaiB-like acyl-CoA transferase
VSSPLTGLKVVELVRILAAPWIGQTLSVLSTVVIKIKSPEGDDTREWGGAPFVDHEGDRSVAYFHCANCRKPAKLKILKIKIS